MEATFSCPNAHLDWHSSSPDNDTLRHSHLSNLYLWFYLDFAIHVSSKTLSSWMYTYSQALLERQIIMTNFFWHWPQALLLAELSKLHLLLDCSMSVVDKRIKNACNCVDTCIQQTLVVSTKKIETMPPQTTTQNPHTSEILQLILMVLSEALENKSAVKKSAVPPTMAHTFVRKWRNETLSSVNFTWRHCQLG